MSETDNIASTNGPHRRAVVSLWLGALLIGCLNSLIWYPGIPNSDSNSEFAQISSGVLNDWHPPAMTRVWQLLLHIGTGTAPLFVLNIALYWIAAALISSALMRNGLRYGAFSVLIVFAFPTFIMQNINITKDVHFAVVLLCAYGIILWFKARNISVPIIVRLLAIALVLYAALIRTNGVFVALPMLAYAAGFQWLRKPQILFPLTVGFGLVLVPLTSIVNHNVLGAHDAGSIRSLQLFDLGGIAHNSGDTRVFGSSTELKPEDLRRCYSPIMWDTLGSNGPCPSFVLKIGRAPENSFKLLPPLGDLWISAIERYPLAYIQHRFASFNSATYFMEPTHHVDAVRVFNTAAIRVPSLKNKALDFFRYIPLLMPGCLIALGLAQIWLVVSDSSVRERSERYGLLPLLTAGLAYGLSFLVVGVATDLRYFIFSDLAILVSAVILMSTSRRALLSGVSVKVQIAAVILAIGVFGTVGSRVIMESPVPYQSQKL